MNRYLSGFCSSQRIFPPQIIQVLLYNALIGKEVLTINREYFRLRKPLERRLYELARKHCGRQPEWKINLGLLQEKTGALSPLKKFRFQLRDIIESDHLPDYQLSLDEHDTVTFANRVNLILKQLVTQAPLPGFEDIPTIRAETIRRGAKLVKEAGTGWDYGALHEQFTEQLRKGFRPRNTDATFLGFIQKKIAYRP